MECWCTQPSSHDGSVHVHSRVRSVSVEQVGSGFNPPPEVDRLNSDPPKVDCGVNGIILDPIRILVLV